MQGYWSRDGSANAGASDCLKVTSGEMFYSYGFPTAFSSNTGLDEVEMDSLYFITDSTGKLFLAMVHDTIGNEDGGFAKILIDAPDVAGLGVEVMLFDDVKAVNYSTPGNWYGQCSNMNTDCHSWMTDEGRDLETWRPAVSCSAGL